MSRSTFYRKLKRLDHLKDLYPNDAIKKSAQSNKVKRIKPTDNRSE